MPWHRVQVPFVLNQNRMAEFICKLGTPAGEIVTRAVEGMSETELRSRLSREGYRVFTVEDSGIIGGIRVNARRGVRIKLDDFLLFNQQLAALIHAGLPVLQSVQMLRLRSPNPKLREVLVDPCRAVQTYVRQQPSHGIRHRYEFEHHRYRSGRSSSRPTRFRRFLPAPTGQLVCLQPALLKSGCSADQPS